jgi:deferrochelatase/peroxidase EfeB
MAAAEATNTGVHTDDVRDIQGNLVGFNKDRQRLVFINFPSPAAGKAFLTALAPMLATAHEVREFNDLYKQTHQPGGDPHAVESAWINVALSAQGLVTIGADITTFPVEFTEGMAAQATALGDTDLSAPTGWLPPFDHPQQVHAMVTLAADPHDAPADNDIDALYARLQQLVATHGVTEVGCEDGAVRPGDQRGHEHFGFKDGISQPGIRGITVSSKAGQDTIATGEFLIGYANQDGAISGSAQAPPPPQPGEPGYPGPAPTPIPALPDWAKNGSFIAYRRLRQDVVAFNQFIAEQAAQLGIDPEQLAAKLVGRWRSGAPMEHVPGLPHGTDPAASDLLIPMATRYRAPHTFARSTPAARPRPGKPSPTATGSCAEGSPTVPNSPPMSPPTVAGPFPTNATEASFSSATRRQSHAGLRSCNRLGRTRAISHRPATARIRSLARRSPSANSTSRPRRRT